jgi:hypothetical protein
MTKSIESLIEERDFDGLEALKEKARSDQDASLYRRLCDELGTKQIDDEILYERGGTIPPSFAHEEFAGTNPFYLLYNISDKCPKSFSEAWNNAMKVPRAERPYQNEVRNRYGQKYIAPAYAVGTTTEKRNYLIKKFPDDEEGIKKLKKSQLNLAYHSIRGVWG